MPLYDYKCSECEHVFEKNLKIAEMHTPESEPCPNCDKNGTVYKVILTPNGFIAGYNLRVSDGFNDVLKGIKKGNPGSTINHR